MPPMESDIGTRSLDRLLRVDSDVASRWDHKQRLIQEALQRKEKRLNWIRIVIEEGVLRTRSLRT